MKQVTVNLKAFRTACEKMQDNGIAFENCSEYTKYNDENNSMTDPLGLCVVNNYILSYIIPYLKTSKNTTVKTYSERSAKQYYGKPQLLAYELFGTVDYWWVILAINDYFISQEFKGWTKLLIPSKNDIESVMDKLDYSNDTIGVNPNEEDE